MNSSDVTAGTNATSTQYNNLRKDLRNALKDLQSNSDGATITFDLSAGAIHTVTLGGNRTLALSNATTGQSFIIILKQDGTGSRTVTWFTSPGAGTPAIKWANATAPTLTTTASRYDIFAFLYDGADLFGSIVGQNYG